MRLLRTLLAFPLALGCGILLALVDVLRAVRRLAARRPESAPLTPVSRAVSIVMLNWNGRELLEESLPLLRDEVRRCRTDCEVILVDNGSSDDSIPFVRERYPDFRVLALPENVGFGEGNNAGVKAATHGLVLLLNNDMLVQPGFVDPLVDAMDPRTFATTAQIFLPPGVRREETGKTGARLRRGLLEMYHEEITGADASNGAVRVLWAGGGSTLYRKDLFLALGGFDRLYSPSYAEDADLSLRAWQSGFESALVPASTVIHKHRSSTRKRFGDEGAGRLMHRNLLLFFLRNFRLGSIAAYLLALPAHAWRRDQARVLLRTLGRWPQMLARRFRQPRPCWTQEEILARVGTPPPAARRTSSGGLVAGAAHAAPGGRPLRVLYVSAYTPHLWRHGGAGRVMQLLHRTAQRHDVSVATFYESDHELKECEKLKEYCREVVAVHRRGRPTDHIFPYEPFREFELPEMREALRALARDRAFDVVHFEYTQMALYADLFPDAVTFLTEVEVGYAAAATKIQRQTGLWRRIKWYYNSLQVLERELELCRRVDHVVCVNETDAELVRGYLPHQQVHVVCTGVDIHYFTPSERNGQAEEAGSLGFIAAFRHEPNIDAAQFFVHEVFPLIRKEAPEARLYLIGSSPPEEIQAWHNGRDITVTGFVEDLRLSYEQMSVIVVPVRTGVGIRGKVLEAWAAGKPVVGTSLAAAGIEARQGENMFVADTPETLAHWTLRLLQNAPARQAMARAARRTAEAHYDWDKLADRLSEIYEAATRGNTTAGSAAGE